MAQLLIALEDKQHARIIQDQVVQNYGFDLLVLRDDADVVSKLELLPDVKVILCSAKFNSKICEHLIRSYEEILSPIQVIVVGEKNSLYPYLFTIPSTAVTQKIVRHIGYLFGQEDTPESFILPSEPEEKTTVFRMPVLESAPIEEKKDIPVEREYVSVSMKYFMHLPEIECEFNFYSRIKKEDGYTYTVKIAANSKVSRSELDRVILRGGKEFFIQKSDFSGVNDFLNGHFLTKFKDPGLSLADKMVLNSDGFEILLDAFKDSSMTKWSVEIIKELVKSMNNLVKAANAIEDFLVEFKHKQTDLSYGYCHSYLTALLILRFVDNFSWKEEHSKNKILYLSLFHDMALHNNRLIRMHHNFEKEQKNLSESELQIVLTHADVSATILETIVKAPKELSSLIREHHGLKRGTGFSNALSLGIRSLSMAFIVTEDFVTRFIELWEKSEDVSIFDFLQTSTVGIFAELAPQYDKLVYADVLKELQKIFHPAEKSVSNRDDT